MKWIGTGNLGMLLLAIFLIVFGASAFVHITAVNMVLVQAVLAIAAGVLILVGR
jgi:hypothetical protein